VDAAAAGRQHALGLGVQGGEVRDVLEHVRGVRHVKGSVGERDVPSVVLDDRHEPLLPVVRLRHVDGNDLEAARAQGQRLAARARADLEDARARRKTRGYALDLSDVQLVQIGLPARARRASFVADRFKHGEVGCYTWPWRSGARFAIMAQPSP
jgi:hypothetical protein